MLCVRLFGGLALESDGVALPMPERRQACSLLGWLALHPGMHPRSEVAARFWPEVLDSSARKSLRTELVAVRHALGSAGEGALVATRDMVGLVGDGVCVDAREFERLVRDARLQEAVELGDGELLAGLDDEWVYAARESHRQRLGDVLERLAAQAEATGALEHAIGLSRRRVELDPLREDAQRELIRRLIDAGELSAARVAFDDLARRLRAELRVPPSRETRRLLDDIHGHAEAAASTADAPPLPAALAAAGAQPVRRPRRRRRLAPRPVVASPGRVRSARGHRRPTRDRQDAARQRARPCRAWRGGCGAPRPLSRGGADLLPAVRRGVRSLRRGGTARGAAGPGGQLRWRARPARARVRPATPRASGAGRRRRGGRALPAVRGRLLPALEHVAIVAGRAGAGGPALGRQAHRPAARARGALDRGRARARHRHLPRHGARRAAGRPCSPTCTASGRSSGCGWEACTAERSPP